MSAFVPRSSFLLRLALAASYGIVCDSKPDYIFVHTWRGSLYSLS